MSRTGIGGLVLLFSIPPAAAQSLRCVAGAATQGPALRAEGMAELAGDIVFHCTDGMVTPAGQPVPTVNITVTLNTNAGSVPGANGGTDAFIILDDPTAGNQVVDNAALRPAITGVDGGLDYKNPSSLANNGQRVPNVFQGRMSGRNQITWLGIPFDPPGTVAQRIMRITNVRSDANLLTRSGAHLLELTVNSTELGIATKIDYGPITQTLTYLGLDAGSQFFTQVLNAGIYYTSETLNVNVPALGSAERRWAIQVGEGGADSFRNRYIMPGTITDPFLELVEERERLDGHAAIGGFVGSSETGYANPAHAETNNAASYGTRLAVAFSGVPQGVDVFLSAFNRPTTLSATAGAAALSDCAGPSQRAPSTNGMVKAPITNGTGVICYEIFRNDPSIRERLFFDGYYSFNGSGASRPGVGAVSVTIFPAPTAFYPPNLYTPVRSAPLFGRAPDAFERSVQTYSAGRFLTDASSSPAIQVQRIADFQNGTLVAIHPNLRPATNVQVLPTNALLPTTITPLEGSGGTGRQATAGWLTVTPSQEGAPLTLNIQANPAGLMPGRYSAAVRIQTPPPTSIDNQLPVSLVIPPEGPRTSPNGVVGAADYFAGAVAPGQAVVVFGSGYGPSELVGPQLDGEGRLAKTLAETRVLFDGEPASLIYAANGQVSGFVPFGVGGRTTTVMTVEYRGTPSPPVHLRVVAAIPGLFTANASGSGQGAILNQDGSLNSVSNPASSGDVIVLFGSGAGQTDPPGVDGRLASAPLPVLTQPVEVEVDGEAAEVLYAGPAPGLAEGVLQVNVRVPANTRRRRGAEVVVAAGGYRSQPGVTVAIGP